MAVHRSKNYYATLGVSRTAKPAEIRNAYRHLARKLHPDLNPGDLSAENRFKEVQEAYEVLKDKQKRSFYDQHGFYSDQAFQQRSARGGRRPPGGGFGFDGFDFTDLGSGPGGAGGPDFASIFDSLFEGTTGQQPGRAARKQGEDLEYILDIEFDDAIRGTTAQLKVNRQRRCASCAGSGRAPGSTSQQCGSCNGSGRTHQGAGNMRFTVPCGPCRGSGRIETPCLACRGEGRAPASDTIRVRIRPGTGENSRIRVAGKGNDGPHGGAPGDLYIVARIGEHPFFQRDGSDISIEVPVTPAEAVLGAKIEVPTIGGKAHMRIPPGTSSGKVFRVRGRGVVDPRNGVRGDQFVRISIVVPRIPDEDTKDLMREYASRNPENPRQALLSKL